LRILEGSRVVETPPGWRIGDFAHGRRVVIDVGAGDGRWAYESARRDRDSLYIALDPDAAALSEYAFKSSRKPSRGGVANVVYVVASIEDPPPELAGAADAVEVIYPWAALLRGLLEPDPAVLRGLVALGKQGAAYELVLTYDASHDHGAGLDAAAPSLDEAFIDALSPAYAAAGLAIDGVRRLPPAEALAVPSTWGHRLLHGRPRDVFAVALTKPDAGVAVTPK
jgi:16S rRNA (adenine(1408)-N(1))-methyltransferase